MSAYYGICLCCTGNYISNPGHLILHNFCTVLSMAIWLYIIRSITFNHFSKVISSSFSFFLNSPYFPKQSTMIT